MINFLKTQILPGTGLNNTQVNTLCGMLDPNKAVIYGSSMLYAAKKVLTMGPANVPIYDIDILTNDLTKCDEIIQFLFTALPNTDLYDTNSYIKGRSSLVNIFSNSRYKSGVNLNTDFTLNPIEYILKSSSVPSGSNNMGNIDINLFSVPTTYGDSINSGINYIFGKNLVFYDQTKVKIQIIYKPDISGNLVNYMKTNGDFTIASGTYDGNLLTISNDINLGITVYRDTIGYYKYPGPPDGKFRPSWMLYRIKKYMDRGYTIYFNTQSQIDTWNTIPTDTLAADANGLPTPRTRWWTALDGSGISLTRPAQICPFLLKPADYQETFYVSCLLKGTYILTPNGYKLIETLKDEDNIITHKGTTEKIIKIKKWTVKWNSLQHLDSQMYKIDGTNTKNLLESQQSNKMKLFPRRLNDLKHPATYISHWHKVLKDDKLVYTGDINLPYATKEEICDSDSTYELYHIQINDYKNNHLVINNGIIVESWDGIN